MNGPDGDHTPRIDPQGSNFAELLNWHLEFGTRPNGGPDQPLAQWSTKEFAGKAGSVDERTVRNWRAGRGRPASLRSIERALFGENPTFRDWRIQLRHAYNQADKLQLEAQQLEILRREAAQGVGVSTALNSEPAAHSRTGVFTQQGRLPNTNVQADTVFRSADTSLEIPIIFDPQIPPALHAEPIYIASHPFIGREDRLSGLDAWGAPDDPHPMLLFNAIGGTGKSFLAWEWVNNRAVRHETPWAGRFWYSFYESDAGAQDFLCRLLSYMSGQPARIFRLMNERDLLATALDQLRSRRWLVVLDGVERLLVHYQRSGSSNTDDRNAGTEDLIGSRDPCATIRKEDARFLRSLLAAAPSKILMTSRLVPSCLVNAGGQALPGLRVEHLSGLTDEDACAMLRAAGVSGDDGSMGSFLRTNCDCHPLVVGVLAGIINDYLPARGDFDAWLAAAAGGQSLNLADLDLVQRQTHILDRAIDALPPDCARILSVLALLSGAVDYATIESLILPAFEAQRQVGLNEAPSSVRTDDESVPTDGAEPLLAKPLSGARQKADIDALKRLQLAVTALEDRGLLQFDRICRRYDLHPVVRGFIVGRMGQRERRRFGELVVDYFSSATAKPFDEAKSLSDIQAGLEVLHALTVMEDYCEAFVFFKDALEDVLRFIIERDDIVLAILRPFFKTGWAELRPEFVDKDTSLFNSAGVALQGCGLREEAYLAHQAALTQDLDSLSVPGAVIDLLNLADSLFSLGKPALGLETIVLAKRLAEAIWDRKGLFLSRLAHFQRAVDSADYAVAEEQWEALDPMGRDWLVEVYRQGTAEYAYARFLFYQGRLTDEALAIAEGAACSSFSKQVRRNICSLRGAWRISQQDWAGGRAALVEAGRTGDRRSGTYDSADVQLLRVRLKLGELDESSPALGSIEPVSRSAEIDLAELRFDLGDRGSAKHHAERAVEWCISRGNDSPDGHVMARAQAILGQCG